METQGEISGTVATASTVVAPQLPAFGHHPFSGTYRTRLEANGRLALPAAFKGAFSDAAIVRPAGRDFLMLMTPRAFELVVDALKAADPDVMLDPRKRQRVFMSAPRISVDRQSRVVLPPELRAKVGLDGEVEVVVAGAIERLELWPASHFDDVEASRLDEVDQLFETFGGLPTDPA